MTHGPRRRHTGTVVAFDEAAGYGTVAGDDDAWFFHCTAVADGSRSVAEGVRVSFVLLPGHRGRWEASDLRPL